MKMLRTERMIEALEKANPDNLALNIYLPEQWWNKFHLFTPRKLGFQCISHSNRLWNPFSIVSAGKQEPETFHLLSQIKHL